MRSARMSVLLTGLLATVAACSSGAAPSASSVAAGSSARSSNALASQPAHLYDPTADAHADIAAALAQARTDGRPVLLDFGADWCPDCHVLSTFLDSPEGRSRIASRTHVVRIDVGQFDRNLDVAKQYGNAIAKGIPAVVVVKPDGSIAGSSADGALANARTMTLGQVLDYLARWID